MTRKRIVSFTNSKTGRAAKVYRDSEWQEYRVVFLVNGKHADICPVSGARREPNSDYCTSDRSDAWTTARTWAFAKLAEPAQAEPAQAPQAAQAARLAELADSVSIAAGELCPDCGGRETESNNATEYRCVACDHRWGRDMGERYGY